jgi:hypothetical protein
MTNRPAKNDTRRRPPPKASRKSTVLWLLAGDSESAEAELSHKQLAARVWMTQPRVTMFDHAARDVSLDQLVRTFAAAGGKFAVEVFDAVGWKASTRL